MAELAKKYDLHPNMIINRKRQAIENIQGILANKKAFEQKDREEEIIELHARIGQLTIEKDFFKKGLGL